MSDPFAFCETLVREADKDRFLASLFAPAALRPALMALYAFNIEVGLIPERVHQEMAAAVRLQWWREVIADERSEEAQGHPVAAALCKVVADHALPFAAFDSLLDAHLFDVGGEAMGSLDDLDAYARATASALFALAARILDPQAEVASVTRGGGIAYAYAGLMRALPRDAARGKMLVPQELLRRHGAQAQDLLSGRTTPQLRAALGDMIGHARAELAGFDAVLAGAPAAVIPALLPITLVPARLDRLERQADPFHPVEVPQWRRQWLMWRAARRLGRR